MFRRSDAAAGAADEAAARAFARGTPLTPAKEIPVEPRTSAQERRPQEDVGPVRRDGAGRARGCRSGGTERAPSTAPPDGWVRVYRTAVERVVEAVVVAVDVVVKPEGPREDGGGHAAAVSQTL